MSAMHLYDNDQQTGSQGTSATLVASATVAALGSFLFGFDTAVISGTTDALRHVFGLTENLLGFTVSCALIGTLMGALLVARPVERWGRKPVLAALAVLFVVASLGCAWAWSWHSLLLFRFLGGVTVGGASVVSPMYITEIAPPKHRGVLVGIAQLNIVLGILAAYCSNYMVALVFGPEHATNWRWMFGVMALPSLAFMATALLIPESPRWLVKRNRIDQARRVLMRIGHENPNGELEEIEQSLRAEMGGVHQRLFQKKYLKPLLLAAMVVIFNQLDGINAILYYAADIFRMAGADKSSALQQSMIVGLANLVMTLVGLSLIDRIGRKALLLVGSVTFILSHGLAVWVFSTHAQGWVVIAAMMGIVGSHAYSQGAVVWVIINELLPNAIRASGAAVICFFMWLLCATVSWLFPVVAKVSGTGAFGFFGAMMVLQLIMVWKYLPETKGVSLEALQKQLGVKD